MKTAAKLATRSETQTKANAMTGRPPFDVFFPESEDIESYLKRMQEYISLPMISKMTQTMRLNDERYS